MSNDSIKIKKYDLIMFISIFLFLLYPYNFSIIDLCVPNYIIILVYLLIGFITFIVNLKFIKSNRLDVGKIMLVFILIFLISFRNVDLSKGHYFLPFFQIFTILYSFILSFNDKWFKLFIKIVIFFSIEHILFTFICYLFPSFYLKNIFPMFTGYSRELLFQFNHHQIAGFTHHYSTNALYLVVGLIIVTYLLIINKGKKYKLLYILNFLALLLTGKRAQVVIYIFSVLFLIILLYRKNILKALYKIVIYVFVFISFLFILINFIPTIGNSFIRIYETFQRTDSLYSRKILFDVANDQFKKNKIIGIGWGGYRYSYNELVSSSKKEREYLLAHCIYMQVLCETGIIGFVFIFSVLFKYYYKSLKYILSGAGDNIPFFYLYFIFTSYFLIEGIIGNTLYDRQIYMSYSFVFSQFIFFCNNKKAGILNEKKIIN